MAAGIDAPLMWSKRGNRQIDEKIRKALPDTLNAPRVLAVNSLWGSVTVQGVLLGKHLREAWNCLEITETHPNALLHLLKHSQESEIQKIYAIAERLIAKLTDHKRDATLSAVAALAMVRCPKSPNWQNLYEHEPCPVQPFNTSVIYWMPIPPL